MRVTYLPDTCHAPGGTEELRSALVPLGQDVEDASEHGGDDRDVGRSLRRRQVDPGLSVEKWGR